MNEERESGNGFSDLMQTISVMPWLLNIPALSVMVFIRRRVGYRQLMPWMLLVDAVLISVGSYIIAASPFIIASPGPPFLFALAMFAFALWQRSRRWKELLAGVRWHTRSRGVSYLAALLPIREDLTVRYVEPLAVILIGWFVSRFISLPLGLWLVFSGFSLSIVEQAVFDLHLEKELDVFDNMIDAEVLSQVASYYDRKGNQGDGVEPMATEETAGIPTGIGADLEKVIAKRRQQQVAGAVAEMTMDEVLELNLFEVREARERGVELLDDDVKPDAPDDTPPSPGPRKALPDNLA